LAVGRQYNYYQFAVKAFLLLTITNCFTVSVFL